MEVKLKDSYKDHFSRQASLYASYRPAYPDSLFSHLASLCKKHDLVWDCGTGNGQAALSLTPYFETVFASDPSEQQIKHAFYHEKINYQIERAEESSLRDDSVDLIVVANALHWFNRDAFYAEANRVLKSNGILVALAYGLPVVSPAIDKMVSYFHHHTLENYWLPENQLVLERYRTIDFPFVDLEIPEFFSERHFDLDELIGYLNSWSAVQRFIEKNKFNPTEDLRKALAVVWKVPQEKKPVRWELMFRVGTKQ